jgi:UDP-N-acetylmuramoylalanine--D-glutamate ligase
MIDFNCYFNNLRGKRIAVLGLGVSNRPLVRLLLSFGCDVTGCDRTPREKLDGEVLALEEYGCKLSVGEGYLDGLEADLVFRTPGMHPDNPGIAALREKGAKVTSEMDVFFALCPCKIIAVTGSDGKTTTTSLIAAMLRSAGKKVWLGGNIGTPLLTSCPEMKSDDIAVVELSSFQLLDMTHSPHVAVVTNLAPNHLDVHKDYQEYIDAKCRIYAARSDCRVVLNAGCPETLEIGMDLIDAGRSVDWFSAKMPSSVYPEGYGRIAYYLNNWIHVKWGDDEIALDRESMLLPGMHNVENLMAAVCACGAEITEDDVQQVVTTFGGVAHRLELVRKINGVPYYNSSIDSSPNRTINALSVFKGNVVLIAGGKDKGIPYDAIGPALAEKVKTLILIGPTAEKIENALRTCDPLETVKVIHCETYSEAVQCAYEAAVPGDTVLLSPASTSFDRFKNFEERGNVFKNLVLQLPS